MTVPFLYWLIPSVLTGLIFVVGATHVDLDSPGGVVDVIAQMYISSGIATMCSVLIWSISGLVWCLTR